MPDTSDVRTRKCPFHGLTLSTGAALPPPVFYPFTKERGECPLLGSAPIGGPPCLMELQGLEPDWQKCPVKGRAPIADLLREAEIHCPDDEVLAANLPVIKRTETNLFGRNRVGKTFPDPDGAVYFMDWYLFVEGKNKSS